VVDVVVAAPGALADRLEAGAWTITLPQVALADAHAAVEQFLARASVEVERMTKKGLRTFDCRAAVVSLAARAGRVDDQECAILDLVVRHGTPAVRPDDILAGLREIAGLVAPVPPLQTRLAQGPFDAETGRVGDPLGHDRDATATPQGDR
jgi:hypothetical protein